MRLAFSSVERTPTQLYQDSHRRFMQAVASLSDLDQSLYYRWYYQQVPVKQLAAQYGLTQSALNRRLRRIQRKLEQSQVAQPDG